MTGEATSPEKKSYLLGILLGSFLIGLPYALGFNWKCFIVFLVLIGPVSFISAYLGLPISAALGAYLGYYGVKEYNAYVAD